MVRDGQIDRWTEEITLLLVHVHGTTPLQVHVMILYLNEYLPLWLWRTCTRVKVVIFVCAIVCYHVSCYIPTWTLYIENGMLWDSISSDLECMDLLKWFVQNADHHCLSRSLTSS